MQRNVSPIVAIVVILIVLAAVAFVWLHYTAGPTPVLPGQGPGRGAREREQRGTRAAPRQRTGARGSRRAGETQPTTPPGGGEAEAPGE